MMDKVTYIEAILLRGDLSAPEKCVAIGIVLHSDSNLENSFPGNRLLAHYASIRKEESITNAIRALKEKQVIANRDPRPGYVRVFRVTEEMITEAVNRIREARDRRDAVRQRPDPRGLRQDGQYVEESTPVHGGECDVQVPPFNGPRLGGVLQTSTPFQGGYSGADYPLSKGVGTPPTRGEVPPATGGTQQKPALTVKDSYLVKEERSSRKSTSAKTRLPAGWKLPDDWRDYALHRYELTAEQVGELADDFRDYWTSLEGKKALKSDWFGTWRMMLRQPFRRIKLRKTPIEPDLLSRQINVRVADTIKQRDMAAEFEAMRAEACLEKH